MNENISSYLYTMKPKTYLKICVFFYDNDNMIYYDMKYVWDDVHVYLEWH